MAYCNEPNSPQVNEKWMTEKWLIFTRVRKTTELHDYIDDFVEGVESLEIIEEIATKPWVNAKVKILDFEILMVLPTAPCEDYELIFDKRSFESLPFHEQTKLLTSAVSRGYKLSVENLDSSSDEKFLKGGSKVTGDHASSSTTTSTGETPKE
ncbi:hypothetical protein ACLOJK_014491 [Asimina triloba]